MWITTPFILHWAEKLWLPSAWCWKLVFSQMSTLIFARCPKRGLLNPSLHPSEAHCTWRWCCMCVGCQVLRDDKHLLNGELVASVLGLVFVCSPLDVWVVWSQLLWLEERCCCIEWVFVLNLFLFFFNLFTTSHFLPWNCWTPISLPGKRISSRLVTWPCLELLCYYPLRFLQVLSAIFQCVTKNPWTLTASFCGLSPCLYIFLLCCLFW